MKKSFCEAWIVALRSGKYKQHRGSLVNFDNDGSPTSYCCLGVLCKVADIDIEKAVVNYDPFTKWLDDIKDNATGELQAMNDHKDKSFPEIADWIETYILPNCTEG